MDPSAHHCLETLALFQGRLGIEYEHIKNLGVGFCIWQSYQCPKFQKCSDFAHILREKSTHQKNCLHQISAQSEHFWLFPNLKIMITLPYAKSNSQIFYMFIFNDYST